YVADELSRHGLQKQVIETIGAVLGGKRVVFTSRKIPVRPEAGTRAAFNIQGHDVSRRQQTYPFKQSQVGKDVLEGEILVQGRIGDSARHARMFKNRFYFRSEDEDSVLAIPVERFHAIAVARQKQFLLFSIEDRKSKHPVKVIDALLAPFFVSVNDDFSVGARVKVIAQGFQLDAQFGKVVNLAVVSDHDVAVAAGHRLMTRG